MKESDDVYAAKRKLIDKYLFFLDNVNSDRSLDQQNFNYGKTQEVGIQFDYKRDHMKCTCRLANGANRRKMDDLQISKQIFPYERRPSSFTDIGIVAIKPLQKKKVKMIYVDNGCGTSYPVGSFYNRQRPQRCSLNKNTISKCVGNCKVKSVSEKLSPIIRITGSASSQTQGNTIIEIDRNTFIKTLTGAMTQVAETLINKILSKETSSYIRVLQAYKNKRKLAKKKKIISQIQSKVSDKESSDSLLQQIHNLENCDSVDGRQSRYSGDPTENALEREYRRLFTSESKEHKKPSKERLQNKASTLKRRIEALRRSFIKTGESTINAVVSQFSSRISASNQRDVAINSDHPSLQAHYYSQTKIYGVDAFPSVVEHDEQTIYEAPSVNNHNIYDREGGSDAQGDMTWDMNYDIQVDNGMFETYNNKLNFVEDPPISVVYEENVGKESAEILPLKNNTEKKVKKKFFLFRKLKKNKEPKSKDDVTTRRCEVKNGLPFKTFNIYKREGKNRSQSISEVYEEMTKAAWVQKYLSNTIESRRSVNIRWNNKKYNAASSTACELIEKIYENTGIFRSKSDVPLDSHNKLLTKQHQTDFVSQNIEAWMIPTNIGDTTKTNSRKIKSLLKEPNHEMEITLSGQKWFIEKSKAFSHKIELVLLSRSKFNPTKSSNYLQIDIPKGFFEDSNRSSKDTNIMKAELDTKIPEQPSKEIAYKIVEYDTGNDLNKEINILKFDAANNKQNIQVTVNVKSNHAINPLLLSSEETNRTPNNPVKRRDVMSRDSSVTIQKRRDLKNRLTNHKDTKRIQSPIKKIQDCLPDYKSKHESNNSKHESNNFKQELKMSKHESKSIEKIGERTDTFLRNYLRLWTLEEIELFSWCASDCLIRSSSDDSTTTPNRIPCVTQSCPHILNDFEAIVSSCDGLSSSDLEYENNSSWYSNDQKKSILFRDQNEVPSYRSCRRVFPKDSIEVYKRRQIIARNDNRCKWYTSNCSNVPPQYECELSSNGEKKPCWKLTCQKSKPNENTSNLKHEILRDCKEPDYFSEMIIDHNEPEVLEPFKSRHAVSCYEVTKLTENTGDQESSEKMTTLSQDSKSTSFELASNLLSWETSLSYDEPSCRDCMISGYKSPQRSLSKPPETTINLTKTHDGVLLTDTILSKSTYHPKPCSQPQTVSPSTKTRRTTNKIVSKTYFSSQIGSKPSPLSDRQLLHLRNSPVVTDSSPSRPLPNSQASFLSTVISCSSVRSEDDDQHKSVYSQPDPSPLLTIEEPRTKIKHTENQPTPDERQLLQQKHISVQSPTFNYEMRRNPKNTNHNEMQCMMSRDIILPYPKPCRDRRDQSRSPCNHKCHTTKMTPQSCQIARASDSECWHPPASVKHTDSYYLTKEAFAAKKHKKDINVKLDDNGRYILLETQKRRYPCLEPVSTKPSSLPRNNYNHPLVQHSLLQQYCGQKPHEQSMETDSPSKSCRIEEQTESSESKSDGNTKTIEINFRFKVPNTNKPINMKILEDNNSINKNKVQLIDQILNNSQEVYISNKESVNSGDKHSDKNDFDISICIKELKSNESKKLDDCTTAQMTTKPKGNDVSPQNKQQRNKQNKTTLMQPKSSYFKIEECTSKCEIQEILINIDNDSTPLNFQNTKDKCTTQKPGPNIRTNNRTQQTIKKTVKSHINTTTGETKTLSADKSDTCKYYTTTKKYEEHISRPGSNVMKQLKTKCECKPKPIITKCECKPKPIITKCECKPKPITPAQGKPQKKKSFIESMYSAANVVLSSNYNNSDNENKMTDEAIYSSLKRNLLKDTSIMSNNSRTDSNITLTDIIILNDNVDYPTRDNRETINEREESVYVASDSEMVPQNWMSNDILWDNSNNRKDSCRRSKRQLKSQQTYCDLCSERDSYDSFGTLNYVDVETQNSRYLTSKYTSPNLSMRSQDTSTVQNCLKRNTQLQYSDITLTPIMTQFASSRGKHKREIKPSNCLRIYNEENIVLRNMEAICKPQTANDNRIKKEVERNIIKEASILQSYATKKAVLEIYTDNIRYEENDDERLVTKLPKFAYDAESDVYDAIAANFNKYRCPKKIPLR